MKRATPFALMLVALTGPVDAFDEKTAAAKEALVSAIRAEDQSRAKPGSTASGRSGIAYIRSLDQAFRKQSRQDLEYPIGQIAENYRSPEVARAIEDLQNAVADHEQQLEDAELAALEALGTEAAGILKTANKPEELDALLEKMSRSDGRSSGRRSDRLSAAYQEVMNTKRFVTQWQDYLQARQSGNRIKAMEILNNLASSGTNLLIPRSRLIALIDADATSAVVKDLQQAEIMELDQIAPVMRELRMRHASSAAGYFEVRSVESQALKVSLAQIDALYQSHKAGLPVSLASVIGSGDNLGNPNDAISARLKAKLLLLILPRLAGAPETTAAKPGEDAIALIGRIIREAGERGDISACIRALEVRQSLEPWAKAKEPADNPLTKCRAGLGQEAAGQNALAVVSYQNALSAGCDPALAKLIGKRLDAIRQAHPDVYKQAMEDLTAPQH